MATINTSDGQSIVIGTGPDRVSINLRQFQAENSHLLSLNSILIEIGDVEIQIRRKTKTSDHVRSRDATQSGSLTLQNSQTQKKTSNEQKINNNNNSKYWDYSSTYGPHNWNRIFPELQWKKYQSPIRIYSEQTEFDVELVRRPLTIEVDDNCCQSLENNGHSFQVSGKGLSRFTGGPVNDEYQFLQFHMHWGSNDLEGSEHVLDGIRYPAELHIVTWNTSRYQQPQEAAASNEFDGLMVFGILIKITPNDNPDFAPLLDLFSKIAHKGEKIQLETNFVSLKSLFPKDTTQYFTYQGSLTTPACSESVRWIVFRERVGLSRQQLEQLRQLKSSCKTDSSRHGNIEDNFRPVMPLNGRVVYRSFN